MNLLRWAGVFLGGLACGAGITYILGSCARDPDGIRADSVLSDSLEQRYKQTIVARDSAIQVRNDSIAVLDELRLRWKDSALALLGVDDKDQAAIDADVAAGVPPGVEPAVFWKEQFDAQKLVAGKLRMQTIPALLATISADSLAIGERDEQIAGLKGDVKFARDERDRMRDEFQRYRDSQRDGLDLGVFRVPGWVVDVAKVGSGAAAVLILSDEERVGPTRPVERPVVSELEL